MNPRLRASLEARRAGNFGGRLFWIFHLQIPAGRPVGGGGNHHTYLIDGNNPSSYLNSMIFIENILRKFERYLHPCRFCASLHAMLPELVIHRHHYVSAGAVRGDRHCPLRHLTVLLISIHNKTNSGDKKK